MLYLVEQWDTIFFTLTKIRGYKPPMMIEGTKITEKEFGILYNSDPNSREKLWRPLAKSQQGELTTYRIKGDARVILGRDDIKTYKFSKVKQEPIPMMEEDEEYGWIK